MVGLCPCVLCVMVHVNPFSFTVKLINIRPPALIHSGLEVGPSFLPVIGF